MTNLVSGESPARLSLSEARALAGRMAMDAIKRASGPAAPITDYMRASMGKGVRSLLLLICAADSALSVPAKAIYLASAVEIFHLATLVHDDIIDDAPTRRGAESVQGKFGKKNAVITGDYLLCAALSTASKAVEENDLRNESENGFMFFNRYMNSFMRICLGEMDEVVNSGNISLSPRRYLKIISGKTAELFRVSALIGAASAGERERLGQIGLIGWNLGMIFQIVDDCKDYGYNAESAQKPVKHDLTQGVVTLPLILALAKAPDLAGEVKDVFSRQRESADLAETVRKAGGVDMALSVAKRYAQKAERLADSLFDGLKRDKTREMINSALSASASFDPAGA